MERLGLTWRLMQAYGLTRLPGRHRARAGAGRRARDRASSTRPSISRCCKAANSGAHAAARRRLRSRRRRQSGLPRPVGGGAARGGRLADGRRPGRRAARPIAPSTSPAACTTRCPAAPPASATSTTPCWPSCACASTGCAWPTWTSTPITATACSYAFYDDPNVLTVSTHERGERLFPGTGFVRELGEGDGAGYSVNLPLEAYTDSAVYLPAFEAVVPPLLERFKPDVIVAQLGIDSHRTDPLTHLALDMQGFAKAFARIAAPGAEARRAWRRRLRRPQRGQGVDGRRGRSSTAWSWPASCRTRSRPTSSITGSASRELWDPPAAIPDDIGRAVKDYVDRQVDAVQKHDLPVPPPLIRRDQGDGRPTGLNPCWASVACPAGDRM